MSAARREAEPGMRVVDLFRAHPGRTAALVALLLTAGLAEAVGLGSLLPLLETVVPAGAPSDARVSRLTAGLLERLGVRPTLGPLLGLVVAALTLKAALRWLAMRQVGHAVVRTALELRLRLIRAALAARWTHLLGERGGHFVGAAGIEAIRAALAYRGACAVLATAVQILAYAGIVLLISWRLALLALLFGGATMLLLGGFVRAGRAAGSARTSAMQSMLAELADTLQGLKPVRAMRREAGLAARLEDAALGLEAAERRQILAVESLKALHEPVVAAVLALGLAAAAAWGGTPLPALLLVGFLLHRTAGRFHQLQTEYQGMAHDESALRSLCERAAQAERAAERRGGDPPPPLAEALTLDHVRFAYEGVDVLRDASLRVPAGRFVLLVGPSGGGKTTLLDLVLGLHHPTAGAVRIDGVPLERVDLAAWRRRIGYVPQETLLLHDTVARNVSLGDASIDDAAVERALRAAGAWDFVARLPHGPGTVVGERGLRLSGGQRQRIAIARALAGGPSLLLLDEPVTALDPESAAAVRRALVGLRGSLTILAVSHEPALERDADGVFELDQGRIRERTAVSARAR